MPGPQGPPKPDELLRLLLEQGKDHALLLLDPGGRVVGWLAGAEHILGYRAEEMVGQPASRLFTPEDVGRGLAEHELVALHGGSVQVRSEGKGRGSEFTVRLPLRQPPPPERASSP